MTWSARIDAARAFHEDRLTLLLRREFKTLVGAIDVTKRPTAPITNRKALDAHQQRVTMMLAAEKQAAALTFGFLALEQIGPVNTLATEVPFVSKSSLRIDEVKAETPKPPTRAERIAAVLRELARTVSTGGAIVSTANALARDRRVIIMIEMAVILRPEATAAEIASDLVLVPRISQAVARVRAEATGAEALGAVIDATEPVGAITPPRNEVVADGGGIVARAPVKPPPPGSPPAPPPAGGGTGGGGPRRSRFNQLVERLVGQEAPVRARRIAQTSGRAIGAVLQEAAREGWSEEKTAAALAERIAGVAGRQRGRVIARTELGSAQNGATYMLALDRQAAGVEMEKGWITAGDGPESLGGRTRDTHFAAHGQWRDLTDTFDVGGARLRYPHDPEAPLRDTVNCRCSLQIRRKLSYRPSTAAP